MKKTRYTEEQIAFALRQAESGTPVAEVIRKMGITEPTFYRWKKQFAGIGVAEIRRRKQLEDENARLKRLVADLTLVKPCPAMPQAPPKSQLRQAPQEEDAQSRIKAPCACRRSDAGQSGPVLLGSA